MAFPESMRLNTDSQEDRLLSALRALKIIDERFTGSLTIHFNQGGISDYDKIEKSLKKRLAQKV